MFCYFLGLTVTFKIYPEYFVLKHLLYLYLSRNSDVFPSIVTKWKYTRPFVQNTCPTFLDIYQSLSTGNNTN
jgi:hypothetical protein